jgi:hypothetical protein
MVDAVSAAVFQRKFIEIMGPHITNQILRQVVFTRHELDDRVEYRRFGQLHRDDDLPAVIRANGSKSWCRNGKRHRDNGPAIIEENGTQEWYRDGKRHRDNGPAIITPDGRQWWLRNGKLHRDDGPAVIGENGMQAWFRDGVECAPKTLNS